MPGAKQLASFDDQLVV